MPTLDIKSFEGGITDEYMGGPPNKAEIMDNVVAANDGDLIQRPAIQMLSDIDEQIPPGNQQIDDCFYHEGTWFVKSGTRLYYWVVDQDSAWTTLNGPDGTTAAFADSELGAGVTWSSLNGILFATPIPSSNQPLGCRTVHITRYDSGSTVEFNLEQIGLPDPGDNFTTTSVTTPATSPNPGFYQWYAVYKREFQTRIDGEITGYVIRSAAYLIASGEYAEIQNTSGREYIWNRTGLGVFEIQQLANDHFDDANIDVEIYRTEKNQTIPKLVKTVAPTATSITDDVPDDELGIPLYTSDGTLDNDLPPWGGGSVVIDSALFMVGITDIARGERYRSRVVQSPVGNPYGIPGSNYVDIDDRCSTIFHVGVHPIVCSHNRTYRIEGRYDYRGGGGMRARLISDSEGCPYPKSIIQDNDFALFFSQTGVCWTDGFKVINLTERDLRSRFSYWIKDAVRATFDRHEKIAYWAVEDPDNSPSGVNNKLLMLNTDFSTEKRNGITTASALLDNMQITAIGYDDDLEQAAIGDKGGFLLGLDWNANYDLQVDTSTAMGSWEALGIQCHYQSCGFDFGSTRLTKWVSKVFALFRNINGNCSIRFQEIVNDEGVLLSSGTARIRATVTEGLHKIRKWANRYGLRCMFKQFVIKSDETLIATWEDLGLATPNNTTNQVVIALGTWPTYEGFNLINYYIFFALDGYTKGYLITAQSGDTLTVADPDNDLPGVVMGWRIYGVAKDESFHLKSVSADYEYMGDQYSAGRGDR